MVAVVAEGERGRIYLSADKLQKETAQIDKLVILQDAPLPHNPRDFKTPNYGMNSFSDLFTNRQLTALTTFSSLISDVIAKAEEDGLAAGMENDGKGLDAGGKGAKAYGEAVGVYLAFVVDRLADRSSTICSWDNGYQKIRNTFGRQAIPMTWDYA